MELAGADARKLLVVLRAKDGDRVEICDSSGSSFSATLAIDGSRVRARLGDAHEPPAPRAIELVLAQALPKGQKMDFAIEKATELGIACIIPFTSERSVAGAARAGKLERWRRLAHTAAQQCGRRDVPAVEDPVEWDVLTERFRSYDLALVPWELAEPIPLRERLPALLRGARSVLIAIGPEGGLSHAEVQRAADAGGRLVSLGSRILRTETAGLVACSAVLYAAGDL